MPLMARLMSRGMLEPPAVTTRSKGALNTGDGGLRSSGCREAACASGGGGRVASSAIIAASVSQAQASQAAAAARQRGKRANGRRKIAVPSLAFSSRAATTYAPTYEVRGVCFQCLVRTFVPVNFSPMYQYTGNRYSTELSSHSKQDASGHGLFGT